MPPTARGQQTSGCRHCTGPAEPRWPGSSPRPLRPTPTTTGSEGSGGWGWREAVGSLACGACGARLWRPTPTAEGRGGVGRCAQCVHRAYEQASCRTRGGGHAWEGSWASRDTWMWVQALASRCSHRAATRCTWPMTHRRVHRHRVGRPTAPRQPTRDTTTPISATGRTGDLVHTGSAMAREGRGGVRVGGGFRHSGRGRDDGMGAAKSAHRADIMGQRSRLDDDRSPDDYGSVGSVLSARQWSQAIRGGRRVPGRVVVGGGRGDMFNTT